MTIQSTLTNFLLIALFSNALLAQYQELRQIGQLTFQNINQYRQSLGLSRMAWSEKSYQLCLKHNAYQAGRNRISHDNFKSRASQLGGGANENVAATWGNSISNPAEVALRFFTMWKNSPGHDKNLRARNNKSGAVAVSYNPSNRGAFATNINIG